MRVFGKGTLKNFDWTLFITILLLCFCGLLALANATADPFAQEGAGLLSRINWELVGWQSLWVGLGVIAFFLMQKLDYRSLSHAIKYFYIALVITLVLLVTIGSTTRGIQGWFQLIGDRAIQPAELGKVIMIVTLATMIAKKQEQTGLEKFREIIPIALVFLVPFVLIAAQPDVGTAAVYAFIFFTMLFIAGVRWRIIGGLIGCGLATLPAVYFLVLQDWQQERILTFFDPSRDLAGSGLNVYYSKIAIGSGGFWGKGLFPEGGLSQLNYVPENQTDFIFASTIEAVGFVGGLVILALYCILMYRVLYLAVRSRDKLGFLISFGVLAMVLFHLLENVGMTMGIMPVTGIPLPFFSYGGSSMLTNMLAFGLVLCVAKYQMGRDPMDIDIF